MFLIFFVEIFDSIFFSFFDWIFKEFLFQITTKLTLEYPFSVVWLFGCYSQPLTHVQQYMRMKTKMKEKLHWHGKNPM